jgi:hypothetical protein
VVLNGRRAEQIAVDSTPRRQQDDDEACRRDPPPPASDLAGLVMLWGRRHLAARQTRISSRDEQSIKTRYLGASALRSFQRGVARAARRAQSGALFCGLIAASVADQLHDRVRKPDTRVGGALARGGCSIHAVNRARHVAMRQADDDREPEDSDGQKGDDERLRVHRSTVIHYSGRFGIVLPLESSTPCSLATWIATPVQRRAHAGGVVTPLTSIAGRRVRGAGGGRCAEAENAAGRSSRPAHPSGGLQLLRLAQISEDERAHLSA